MPERKKVFVQITDLELWVVNGSDASVPVLVRPGITCADERPAWLIGAGMPLDADQMAWLTFHMDSLSKAKYLGYWLVRPDVARKIMVKPQGITPEHYLRWGNMLKKENGTTVYADEEDPGAELTASASAEAFVVYTCNYAGMDRLSDARYLYLQFCRCMVNWLLVEKKPLDLVFARIHAFPYRSNWQSILAAKFPHFKEVASMPPDERMKHVEGSALHATLEDPSLISMHNPTTFDWSLSVEPRPDWYAHAREIEANEASRSDPTAYYGRWLKCVQRLRRGIVSTFSTHFLETLNPVGDTDTSLPAYRRFLRWLLEKGRVRPVTPSPVDVAYISGQGELDQQKPTKNDSHRTFETLPTLPDEDRVPWFMDLRKTGRVDRD